MKHAPTLALQCMNLEPMEFEIGATWQHTHSLEFCRFTIVTIAAIRYVPEKNIGPDAPAQHRDKLDLKRNLSVCLHNYIAPAFAE
jgi:hypothetical protein